MRSCVGPAVITTRLPASDVDGAGVHMRIHSSEQCIELRQTSLTDESRGEFTFGRFDHEDAITTELCYVALHTWLVPHVGVHCGGNEQWCIEWT